MLLLRGARAACTAAGTGATRSVSIRLTPVASLSSSPSPGGRGKKGQRRGGAKPPSPAPAPPQPLPKRGEALGKKSKSTRPPAGKKDRAAEEARGPPPRLEGQARKGTQQQPQDKPKRVVRWKCATGCGACCKLDKGPDFPTPDEIFADHPEHLEVYKSMIGADGWCNNYDKSTRTCNIYEDRPFFCRVEPKVFEEFFGVARSRFDREACSACLDNIKMVYGEESTELKNFKRVIREESNKAETEANMKLDTELDVVLTQEQTTQNTDAKRTREIQEMKEVETRIELRTAELAPKMNLPLPKPSTEKGVDQRKSPTKEKSVEIDTESEQSSPEEFSQSDGFVTPTAARDENTEGVDSQLTDDDETKKLVIKTPVKIKRSSKRVQHDGVTIQEKAEKRKQQQNSLTEVEALG